MAILRPFPALRYDHSRLRPADVLTQPYDKITPAMQDRYYQASPYNLVRIILGKAEEEDSQGRASRYTRAASYFQAWQREGVLVRESRPALFAYAQRFSLPWQPGRTLERRGFIALGPLHEYSDGVVFRHEKTLSGPKVDRLELLRATQAQFELLFMLYDDPARTIEGFAFRDLPAEPEVEMTDEYGVVHRLWSISQPFVLEAITGAMRPRPLIIADGHHRYETARAFALERRGTAAPLESPFDFAPMAFFNAHSEELAILPTHRVVFGLKSFDFDAMLEKAQPFFFAEALPGVPDGERARVAMAEAGRDGSTVILAVSGVRAAMLKRRPDADAGNILASVPALQRELDIVQLHKLLLEHVLGISEDDIREQRHLNYVRDAQEAMQRARNDANVSFLINPVSVRQTLDIALAGEVMPQKSTDFYPKLLSGLAIYDFS